MDIRDNLRALIWDRGFSQTRIAEKSHMTDSQLSMVLTKRRKLDANELFDLCNAMEITPTELRDYKQPA